MLHHVTLHVTSHVTLQLVYFTIDFDMLQHVTPTFLNNLYILLKSRCNMSRSIVKYTS